MLPQDFFKACFFLFLVLKSLNKIFLSNRKIFLTNFIAEGSILNKTLKLYFGNGGIKFLFKMEPSAIKLVRNILRFDKKILFKLFKTRNRKKHALKKS
jgi:hypothetical protein